METEAGRAAFVVSQSVCAMVKAMGMFAVNQDAIVRGETIVYDDAAFSDLIGDYGLGSNTVIFELQGR